MVKFNFKGIKGLTLIKPKIYKDERGHNFEAYDSSKFKETIYQDENLKFRFKNKDFVLDTFSKSKKNSGNIIEAH